MNAGFVHKRYAELKVEEQSTTSSSGECESSGGEGGPVGQPYVVLLDVQRQPIVAIPLAQWPKIKKVRDFFTSTKAAPAGSTWLLFDSGRTQRAIRMTVQYIRKFVFAKELAGGQSLGGVQIMTIATAGVDCAKEIERPRVKEVYENAEWRRFYVETLLGKRADFQERMRRTFADPDDFVESQLWDHSNPAGGGTGAFAGGDPLLDHLVGGGRTPADAEDRPSSRAFLAPAAAHYKPDLSATPASFLGNTTPILYSSAGTGVGPWGGRPSEFASYWSDGSTVRTILDCSVSIDELIAQLGPPVPESIEGPPIVPSSVLLLPISQILADAYFEAVDVADRRVYNIKGVRVIPAKMEPGLEMRIFWAGTSEILLLFEKEEDRDIHANLFNFGRSDIVMQRLRMSRRDPGAADVSGDEKAGDEKEEHAGDEKEEEHAGDEKKEHAGDEKEEQGTTAPEKQDPSKHVAVGGAQKRPTTTTPVTADIDENSASVSSKLNVVCLRFFKDYGGSPPFLRPSAAGDRALGGVGPLAGATVQSLRLAVLAALSALKRGDGRGVPQRERASLRKIREDLGETADTPPEKQLAEYWRTSTTGVGLQRWNRTVFREKYKQKLTQARCLVLAENALRNMQLGKVPSIVEMAAFMSLCILSTVSTVRLNYIVPRFLFNFSFVGIQFIV